MACEVDVSDFPLCKNAYGHTFLWVYDLPSSFARGWLYCVDKQITSFTSKRATRQDVCPCPYVCACAHGCEHVLSFRTMPTLRPLEHVFVIPPPTCWCVTKPLSDSVPLTPFLPPLSSLVIHTVIHLQMAWAPSPSFVTPNTQWHTHTHTNGAVRTLSTRIQRQLCRMSWISGPQWDDDEKF